MGLELGFYQWSGFQIVLINLLLLNSYHIDCFFLKQNRIEYDIGQFPYLYHRWNSSVQNKIKPNTAIYFK